MTDDEIMALLVWCAETGRDDDAALIASLANAALEARAERDKLQGELIGVLNRETANLVRWEGKVEAALADLAAARAELATARDRLAVVEGTRVKPLLFSDFSEGGCMGRPHPFQYFITQAHDGRFLCHHDETWHETLEAAQTNAQTHYARAALQSTLKKEQSDE